MWRSYVLAALIGVAAVVPALAQKRAPTVHYTDHPSTPLDKNFGLPTFGMPGTELPQQRTQAPTPRPVEKPDLFNGFTPLNAPAANAPEEHDFFKDAQEITLPKTRPGSSGYSTPTYTTPETPLFTTGQTYLFGSKDTGMTTGGMTTGSFGTGEPTDAGDAAN